MPLYGESADRGCRDGRGCERASGAVMETTHDLGNSVRRSVSCGVTALPDRLQMSGDVCQEFEFSRVRQFLSGNVNSTFDTPDRLLKR